jgi:hypothetical protein
MRFLYLKKPFVYLSYLCFVSLMLFQTVTEARAKKSFLDFVPAETPYLINYKIGESLAKFLPKKIKVPVEDEIMKDKDSGMRMSGLLFRDFIIHFKEDSLAELGLTKLKDLELGVHGLGIWPVLSLSVQSQSAFTKWIVKSAKKAGVKPQQDGKSLIIPTQFDSNFKSSIAISFIGSHWVNIAIIPTVFSKKMLPYLNGQVSPKTSMAASKQLLTWAKEVDGSEQHLSFIGFKRIAKTLLGRGEGLNNQFSWIDDSITKSISEPCMDEYIEVLNAMPYLVSGLQEGDQSGSYEGKTLLKLSNTVAKVAQSFMPKSLYLGSLDGSLGSVSFGLNIRKAIEGVQSLLQYRIQNPFTCHHLIKVGLDPQKLQMMSSQLMMIPPFIYDVYGISINAYNIDKKEPKGTVILSAKNVVNLLNIAKSMNPSFAKIKIPKVGTGPQKLEGVPAPPSINLMIQLEKNALGLSIGAEQTKELSTILKTDGETNPSFYRMSYDLGLIMDKFYSYLKASKAAVQTAEKQRYKTQVELAKAEGTEPPPPPKFDDDEEQMEMLQNMNFGLVKFAVYFTKEGLELTFQTNLK